MKITPQGKDKISIEIDGKPFTDFYIGPQASKPYLHPLRTAHNKPRHPRLPHHSRLLRVKRQDKPRHKGLWFAHGNVNGSDSQAGDPETPLNAKLKGHGKIVMEKVGKI